MRKSLKMQLFSSQLYQILEIVFKISLPIILVIVIIIIMKIVKNYKIYGKNLFRSFKKPDIVDYKYELIFNMINNYSNNRHILKLKNLSSDYLIIDKNCVHVIMFYEEEGLLEGKSSSNYLNLRENRFINKRVVNPYKLINDDIDLIEDKFELINVKKYVVTNNNCSIVLDDYTDINTVKLKDLVILLKERLAWVSVENIDIDNVLKKFTHNNYIKSDYNLDK